MQDVRNAMLFLNKFRVGNVSLTISLGIPGQTEASWRNTLHACVIMKPAHITVESLPEAGAQNMPDGQERFAMYASACDYLQQNGYTQYSAGHFCLFENADDFICAVFGPRKDKNLFHFRML